MYKRVSICEYVCMCICVSLWVCYYVCVFISALCVYVCLSVCVVCTYLGNGKGCRTVTITATLLLTNGPVRYETVLHNNLLVFVCVCVRRDVCRGRSGLNQINVRLCCTWRDKPGMWRGCMQWCSGSEPSFVAEATKSVLGRGQ